MFQTLTEQKEEQKAEEANLTTAFKLFAWHMDITISIRNQEFSD